MSEKSPAQRIEDAYLYAYPLVLLDLIREMVTNTEEPSADRAPINQLFHTRDLCTPAITSLTRPNVDTLYSQAYLDLTSEPVLLTKPATERFLSIQTFNGYSDTPFILGSGGPGDPTAAATYAFTGAGFEGALPDDAVEVPMGTDLVWLLIRIRVETADDLAAAREVQDQLEMRPLSAHGKSWTPPRGVHEPDAEIVAMERISQLTAKEFFTRFNKLAVHNPGTAADEPLLTDVAPLGIGPGLRFELGNLPDAAKERAATLPGLVDQTYAQANTPMSRHNGWYFMDENVSQFGTDYRFRAVVAHGGFANPVRLTTYPAMVLDENDQFLSGADDYSIRFEPDQLPPHLDGGWWSLTAYTLAGQLIDNEIDRYVVGSASELELDADGGLELLLSATSPGSAKERNWLPITDDLFSLVMRIYLPTEAVIDHTWQPPKLVKR